jgi:hypothetical protein
MSPVAAPTGLKTGLHATQTGMPGAKMAALDATGRGRIEGLTPLPEEGPVA